MEIKTFHLSNTKGMEVGFCNIGAGIISLLVHDRYGNVRDVVLGYANLSDYSGDSACMGKIPGRYANRIAEGRFSIDNNVYTLAVNNGDNHLHGGNKGFADRIWLASQNKDSLTFTYFSEDGQEGYPGNLTAKAVYSLNDNNELRLVLTAVTDKPTVVNLTNHSYFNLKGEGNGNILDHRLQLFASRYLPTDKGLIPTGELRSVVGTPMDFTNGKLIGQNIRDDFDALLFGKGYDNCWVLDKEANADTESAKQSCCCKDGELHKAALLCSDESGIALEVLTTQPAVQIYTGNYLAFGPAGKNGHQYNDYDGVAVECQAFPDSPNKEHFPTTLLMPEQEYRQEIIFRFHTF
ncbi:MAG: galactose mutarotase [Bacteroidales bacterium]|nr:galactose mutarotase [Bacteroidales bacterium]